MQNWNVIYTLYIHHLLLPCIIPEIGHIVKTVYSLHTRLCIVPHKLIPKLLSSTGLLDIYAFIILLDLSKIIYLGRRFKCSKVHKTTFIIAFSYCLFITSGFIPHSRIVQPRTFSFIILGIPFSFAYSHTMIRSCFLICLLNYYCKYMCIARTYTTYISSYIARRIHISY